MPDPDSGFSVVLGCDCDPDRGAFGGNAYGADELVWQGNEVGIDRFRRAREVFHSRTDLWPKMTWFVRADHQVGALHGDAGWCLRTQKEIWRALEAEGDEIAWHPHLWAKSDEQGWHQRVGDDAFTRECLEDGYRGFCDAWGVEPKSVHMGWCFQDNTSMSVLAKNGLIADCSVVPGHNSLGAGRLDQSDWSVTPKRPYRPSRADYRRPARESEGTLPIIELPVSVGSSAILQCLKTVRFAIKHGQRLSSLSRFSQQVPNLTFHPALFRPIAERAVARAAANEDEYFMTYCHSDELLQRSDKSGPARWLHRLQNVFANIEYLAQLVELRMARGLTFQTVTALASEQTELSATSPNISPPG